MTKRLLSLFSGCGGMDIGFEGGFTIPKVLLNKDINSSWVETENTDSYLLQETGFKTVFAIDINERAKIAWNDYFSKRDHFSETVYHVESIVDLVKRYKDGDTSVFPENIDVVTGGFPCQDFSLAGKRKGFDSHKDHNGKLIEADIPSEETRGKLYMWMKEVIEITKPKVFVAENVKGLANLGEVKDIIQSDFSSVDGDGYFVFTPRVLHGGNYGVPQSRERIIFIGIKKSALKDGILEKISKDNIDFDLSPYPQPTHRLNGEILYSKNEQEVKHFIPVKDVLKDLLEPDISNDLSQQNYSKAKYMGKHLQGQTEINPDKLGPTIRAEHHGNIEFRRLAAENGGKIDSELNKGLKERRLTLRECARIQTFPDDFNFVIPSEEKRKRFALSPSEGYKLVGNAVPPLLAYHIAKKIESVWSKYFK